MVFENTERRMYLHGFRCLLLMFAMFSSGTAFALSKGAITNGYSGCRWVDNGGGTITVSVTIDFKETDGNTGGYLFVSRGVMLYTYNKYGKMNSSSAVANGVYFNEKKNSSVYAPRDDYAMYYGKDVWETHAPIIANIDVVLDSDKVRDWPALSIRAGNFTNQNDIAEIKGGAYITPYGDGVCQVVDPERPPPASIGIKATVPDWNLGELPRGDGQKTFVNSAEQLCFTYAGQVVSDRTFVINASNANGVANNRYLLKNLTDASQTVPYSVTLNSGTDTVTLPNSGDMAASFSTTGKTCFVPTFKTSVGNLVKEGNYSDVLTFTVVTKS
ncbi:hypothetical protein ACJ51O_26735 [Burkholderia pyrrocinia]|uniref:hypothetical protein n=1 Tax=Burkholderia pyrrocinia TaxID=60550 RepID=UPI0038B591F3